MDRECFILIVGILTLAATIWGICASKRLQKKTYRQNLEAERARIEIDLKEVNVQIEREKSAGHEQMGHIYGGHHQTNPHISEITALWEKQSALEKRKAEIDEILKTL